MLVEKTSRPISAGARMRSIRIGIGASKLSAKKEDLCRVIDPHYKSDKRAGSPIGRSDTCCAYIQREQGLADREQERR